MAFVGTNAPCNGHTDLLEWDIDHDCPEPMGNDDDDIYDSDYHQYIKLKHDLLFTIVRKRSRLGV